MREPRAPKEVGAIDDSQMRTSGPEWQMNKVAERFRSYSDRRRQIVGTVGNRRSSPPAFEPMSGTSPFEDLLSAVASPVLSPLEELIAAVTAPPPGRPPVEPLSPRFTVRVAHVGQPHRPTKRNYDYFRELDAALAEQAKGRGEQLRDQA
jgi:hypothetical protein